MEIRRHAAALSRMAVGPCRSHAAAPRSTSHKTCLQGGTNDQAPRFRHHQSPHAHQGRCARRSHPSRRSLHHFRARGCADQDRRRQSADRHLRLFRQERAHRLRARGRSAQRQERHPRAQDRAPLRRFHQRRRRRGGAEGAQADRARQCRLSGRQRELGARPGHGPSLQREGRAARRPRRTHRRHHRRQLQMERVPGLQHHAHGSERGVQPAVQDLRQEMALHHARLCVWAHRL